MKKGIGKRLGCAALATQMLLSPVAQATSLDQRELVSTKGLLRQSEWLLDRSVKQLTQRERLTKTFPRLAMLSRAGTAAEQLPPSQTAASTTDINVEGAYVLHTQAESPLLSQEDSLSKRSLGSEPEEALLETGVPSPVPTCEGETELDNITASQPEDGPLLGEQEEIQPPVTGTDDKVSTEPEEGDLPVDALAPDDSDDDNKEDMDSQPDGETPEDVSDPKTDDLQIADGDMLSPAPELEAYAWTPAPEIPCLDALVFIFGFGPDYGWKKTYHHKEWTYNFEGDWVDVRGNVNNVEAGEYGHLRYHVDIVRPVYGNNWLPSEGDEDPFFVWDGLTGSTYWTGLYWTQETNDALPQLRLPNREYSGKWYVYDGATAGSDEGKHLGYNESSDFIKENYAVVYDPVRDGEKEFDRNIPLEEYLPYMCTDTEYFLPLVGKWDLSTNASMTRLCLQNAEALERDDIALYPVTGENTPQAFAEMTAQELESITPIDQTQSELAPEQWAYFARVPEQTESLQFRLETYEPGSTITLRVSYDGQETAYYGSDQLEHAENITYTLGVPDNSADKPARGIWTFPSGSTATIPLAESGENIKYNKLSITVTAPDGKSQENYEVYIQRLATPQMKLKPGNTPLGMIEREPNLTDEEKEKAKEIFKTTKAFYGDKKISLPSEINNNGNIQEDAYASDAWVDNNDEGNIDLDPTAIVIYENASFLEPGFELYDAIGNKHEGANANDDQAADIDIKWKLELKLVDKLGPDVIFEEGEETSHSWEGTGNVDSISLIGYNVKPGVYRLDYTYFDEYDTEQYTGNGFSRTVVVLPLRGDVDMDGEVTAADGLLLQKLLDEGIIDIADIMRNGTDAQRLYAYRVCNVDGMVLDSVYNRDVNSLLSGYDSVLRGMDCTYFYLPLPEEETKQRTEVVEGTAPDKAAIKLTYLGMGTQPDKLDLDGRIDYEPSQPSVFWLNAQLEHTAQLSEQLQGEVTAFTLTVSYDANYVEPFLPEETDANWVDYVISQNPQWAGWTISSAEKDITPVDHASKALSNLESDKIKELRFTITAPSGETGIDWTTVETNGLMKVPFRLTTFPMGKADTDVKLAELTLGMRDLMIATTTGSATWDNLSKPQQLNSVTQNLADSMSYAGSDLIPLGSDKTPCYRVYLRQTEDVDPIYGDEFISNTYGIYEGEKADFPTGASNKVVGSLPKGVTYNSTMRYLSGTPEEAGEFNFRITGSNIPFRLVVDKATLTLTAEDVAKYYGEEDTSKQTFHYDVNQIKTPDRNSGKTNSGTEEDLSALLEGYVRPTIKLVTTADKDSQKEIEASTVPGEYVVLLQGGSSKNYQFQYTQMDKNDPDADQGTAKLIILNRPILIDEVTKKPIATLWDSDTRTRLLNQTVGYQSAAPAKEEFTFASVSEYVDKDGNYTDPVSGWKAPLKKKTMGVVGNDAIELEVDIQVIKTDKEKFVAGYILTQPRENRDAEVEAVRLAADKGQNQYYTLLNSTPKTPHVSEMVQIQKQNLIKMVVQSKPQTSFQYGQGLLMGNLTIALYYEGREEDDYSQVRDTIAVCERDGLTVQWVSGNKVIPDKDSPKAADGQELSVMEHNGKWLCFSGAGEDPARVWIGPYTIAPRPLELTIEASSRYYGEEITDWTIRYDPSQLAKWDQERLPDAVGLWEELEMLPGHKSAPTLQAMKTPSLNGVPVTATTDVGDYYVLVYNAENENYRFRYTCTTDEGEAVGTQETFGYAPLTVLRRPILVTKIVASAGSLFHNSESYVIQNAKAVCGNDSAGFEAMLPAEGISYYTPEGQDYPPVTMPLTGSVICFGDAVSVTYRAEFEVDNNDGVPWFEMGSENVKRQPVKVSNLKLETSEKEDNYQLIYKEWAAVMNGWAGDTAEESVTYGTIYRQRIRGFQILSGPTKQVYDYGDKLSLTGLRVKIWYEPVDGGEVWSEEVSYIEERHDGVWSDTFTKRGLSVTWEVSDGKTAYQEQQLSVAEHNGKHLVVTGPQYSGEPIQVQRVSEPITVRKKLLPVTVKDIQRTYGEENGVYTFTFQVSDLAQWDQVALGSERPEGTASQLDVAATSIALKKINAPYEKDGDPKNQFIAPHFTTIAEKRTPVQQTPYALELVGGRMANYTLELVAGGITIEKRPIMVTSIVKEPVYAISEGSFNSSGVYVSKTDAICYAGTFEDGERYELTLATRTNDHLSGPPLLEGDGIAVSMQVRADNKPVIPAGADSVMTPVTLSNFALAVGGDNYTLVGMAGNTLSGQGEVHKRKIRSVEIWQQPNKSEYTYGEDLDLNGMNIKIVYETGEIAFVKPGEMEGVYVNYWQSRQKPTIDQLLTIVESHPAATGDHLTRAEINGFSHNGKYLLVSAKNAEGFIEPDISKAPITVNRLPLTYKLTANNKPYDGNRKAVGTIQLTNVYPGDELWIQNGTDYSISQIPSDHAFTSGSSGITFTFIDENVHYRETDPDRHIFAEPVPISVEVDKIAIGGQSKENYEINPRVTTNTAQILGRDKAPTAIIWPKEQLSLKDVKIDLWVDEHTNTVTVLPEVPASSFVDRSDKYNAQLHYEYALIYLDGENWVQTDYQDSPYFGGEKVTVTVPDFEPDGTPIERPVGTGGGQTTNSADKQFGLRKELPRGIYMGALLRLSQTNNYRVSEETASCKDYAPVEEADDQSRLMSAYTLACADMDKTLSELPEPGKDTERLTERVKGPVVKTYTYRVDLISTVERTDIAEEKYLVPILEEVWFTDIVEFKTEKELDRMVDNCAPVRYYGYYWDKEEKVKVSFALKLDEPIEIELPEEEEGTRLKKIMNEGDIIKLYVPVYRSSGGGYTSPTSVRIEPEELTIPVDGEPIQLEAIITPSYTTERRVTWHSSDESIVKVSADGLVTAVAIGEAKITVRTSNGLTDTITVKVVQSERKAFPYSDTMFNTGYTGAFLGLYNGLFEPERTMTRAELTVMMEHFFQMVEGRIPSVPNTYIDIPSDTEYLEEVQLLDQWGIVNGIGEDLYAPDRVATRAEISIILCRMLMLPVKTESNGPHAFIDAGPEDTWAWAYIDALAEAGITKGTGDGTFNPDRPLTRAEAATLIARILVTKIDMDAPTLIVPRDVPKEYWAYKEILRAVNSGAVLFVSEE